MQDKLAASVLSFYGIVDGLFCVLFFRTAYLHRNNLLGDTGVEETLQAVVKSSMKKSVAVSFRATSQRESALP